jgi:hypothetical protein
MKNAIRNIPFIILMVYGICLFYHESDWYKNNYFIISQIFGSSLIVCGYMFFYAYVHRYCLYSWICIICLAVLNILNLFYSLIPISYYQIYSNIIIFTGTCFGIVRIIKPQTNVVNRKNN